jgi:hypothetical protein
MLVGGQMPWRRRSTGLHWGGYLGTRHLARLYDDLNFEMAIADCSPWQPYTRSQNANVRWSRLICRRLTLFRVLLTLSVSVSFVTTSRPLQRIKAVSAATAIWKDLSQFFDKAIMSARHVEMVVTMKPNADRPAIEGWLTSHGFSILPMQAGVLVAGSTDLFMSLFGVDLNQSVLPVRIQFPSALQRHIESAEVQAPPEYH